MTNLNEIMSASAYGNHGSHYGTHCMSFTNHKKQKFYMSYETLVAFATADGKTFVSENIWSRTTGKHISTIKKDCCYDVITLPYTEFCQTFNTLIAGE